MLWGGWYESIKRSDNEMVTFSLEYLMDNLFLLDIDGISIWDDVTVCIKPSSYLYRLFYK